MTLGVHRSKESQQDFFKVKRVQSRHWYDHRGKVDWTSRSKQNILEITWKKFWLGHEVGVVVFWVSPQRVDFQNFLGSFSLSTLKVHFVVPEACPQIQLGTKVVASSAKNVPKTHLWLNRLVFRVEHVESDSPPLVNIKNIIMSLSCAVRSLEPKLAFHNWLNRVF